MKLSSVKYTIVAGVTLLFYSCHEEMPIDLDTSESRLVVEGVITTDTASHFIKLANSANYFYNKPLDPVQNAIVQISDGEDTVTLTESVQEPGYYYTQPEFYGVVGKTYKLIIKNVDINTDNILEEYTASSILRSIAQPDSIRVVPSYMSFVDYEVKYFGVEPEETHDYYLFKVRRNGVMLTDTITETFPSDDFFYNGIRLNNVRVYMLFKSKVDENIQMNDTITLENSNITKEYFQFLNDLQQESQGGGPFGGQPANVSTNVVGSGKSIGFFAAYAISRASYIIKETDLKK